MSANARREIDATSMTVRRAFQRDFPTILDISNWAACHTAANFRTEPYTLEYWIDLWKGKALLYPWFVVERDGAVKGFAMASPFMGRCGFSNAAEVTVYVHPEHLGERMGRALYARLIPTLREQGFRALVAVIAIPNAASEALHNRFGFREVGKLARVGWKFGKWHDLACWQLLFGESDDPPMEIRPIQNIELNGVQA